MRCLSRIRKFISVFVLGTGLVVVGQLSVLWNFAPFVSNRGPMVAPLFVMSQTQIGDAGVWVPTEPWQPVFHREWCYPDPNASAHIQTNFAGLLYVRIPKTSSSSLGGLNIRLAQRIGSQVLPPQPQNRNVCSYTRTHLPARRRIATRKRTESRTATSSLGEEAPLVWTFLRDPAARMLSNYFFIQVSRHGKSREMAKVMKYMKRHANFMFEFVRKSETQVDWGLNVDGNVTLSSLPPRTIVQRLVLDSYNFIGLVERREESLAVMKLLWNLTTADLIVLPSKSGGYDDGANGTCVKIQQVPQTLRLEMSSYLDHEFRRENSLDYLMYAMVNETLDKTILSLGKENVMKEVDDLRRLQQLAEDSCFEKTIFPCSPNGTLQKYASGANCYFNDLGCGYPCVDRVLADFS